MAPQAEAPQAEAPQAEAPQAEAPQAEAPQADHRAARMAARLQRRAWVWEDALRGARGRRRLAELAGQGGRGGGTSKGEREVCLARSGDVYVVRMASGLWNGDVDVPQWSISGACCGSCVEQLTDNGEEAALSLP